MKLKIVIILLITSVFIGSCRKEKCENATVTGLVRHHSKLIPNAMVYIKYGSKDMPANPQNPNTFDEAVQADANAWYTFLNKAKGDYYLYAVGYDEQLLDSVYGGAPLGIECKSEVQTISKDIPVIE
jgi:hypothetical protein